MLFRNGCRDWQRLGLWTWSSFTFFCLVLSFTLCIFYNPLRSFTWFPSPRCHLQSERCRSLQETLKSLQKQTLQRSLQRAALKPRSTWGQCVTLPRLVPIGKHLRKHRSIMKHHLKHSNHSIFRYDLEVFGRTEQELVANLNAFRFSCGNFALRRQDDSVPLEGATCVESIDPSARLDAWQKAKAEGLPIQCKRMQFRLNAQWRKFSPQPLSHSARVADAATQPLSHSEWLSGCSSHSGRVAEWLLRCFQKLFCRIQKLLRRI